VRLTGMEMMRSAALRRGRDWPRRSGDRESALLRLAAEDGRAARGAAPVPTGGQTCHPVAPASASLRSQPEQVGTITALVVVVVRGVIQDGHVAGLATRPGCPAVGHDGTGPCLVAATAIVERSACCGIPALVRGKGKCPGEVEEKGEHAKNSGDEDHWGGL